MSERCPKIESCPMFQLMSYAGTLAAWKIRYCEGPYQTCARFDLSRKGRPVPINLMPNGAMLNKKVETGT